MPTPVSTPQKAPAVAESPGTWKHPRMAEITRRQAASSFTEKNALTILWNATGFCAILAGGYLIQKYTPISTFVPVSMRWYASWAWFAFKLLPIVNILLAFRPLFQKPDDLSDIPLSKDQRKLLGLPKTSGPDTPDLYRTPPRYSRTPSISGSVGSRNGYSGSPLSGRGSPAPPASPSASTFSPIAASPLLQKAMGGVGARRSSFGSPSPLGVSTSTNLFVDSPSNSSLTGKRSSIGLNNKWLYEKGRRASGHWYN